MINCGVMTISTTAGIIGTGFGFLNYQGPGRGSSNSHGAGAGHGGSEIRNFVSENYLGDGGESSSANTFGGVAYGAMTGPQALGSGGGNHAYGWGGGSGGWCNLNIYLSRRKCHQTKHSWSLNSQWSNQYERRRWSHSQWLLGRWRCRWFYLDSSFQSHWKWTNFIYWRKWRTKWRRWCRYINKSIEFEN